MIRIVLTAIDASPRAPGVLSAAREVAERFGATLHIFRAVLVPPDIPAAAHGTMYDPVPVMLRDHALQDLRSIVAANPSACPLVIEEPAFGVGQPWHGDHRGR